MPFSPKADLKVAKSIQSQHTFRGGLFDFDGNFENFKESNYLPAEIRRMMKELFTVSLSYGLNLDKVFPTDKYLHCVLKTAAVLAYVASRACGAHYY